MDIDVTRTFDLDLAALLIAEGARLARIESGDTPGRRVFVLDGMDATRVRALIDTYSTGDVVVALDRFLDARRMLVDRLNRADRLGMYR